MSGINEYVDIEHVFLFRCQNQSTTHSQTDNKQSTQQQQQTTKKSPTPICYAKYATNSQGNFYFVFRMWIMCPKFKHKFHEFTCNRIIGDESRWLLEHSYHLVNIIMFKIHGYTPPPQHIGGIHETYLVLMIWNAVQILSTSAFIWKMEYKLFDVIVISKMKFLRKLAFFWTAFLKSWSVWCLYIWGVMIDFFEA